jgi:hypothetical protein
MNFKSQAANKSGHSWHDFAEVNRIDKELQA